MTKQPAPVHVDAKKVPSRDYRANIADHANMLLRENRPKNVLDPKAWQGNGFPGHFQFVQFLGRDMVRPGKRMQEDMQTSSLPYENARLLNTTMMGRAQLGFTSMPAGEEQRAHEEAIASLKTLRSHAQAHHRAENPHAHARNELNLSLTKQTRLMDVQESMKGMRGAGLASINPRMGTCGSLPSLIGNRGPEALHAFRDSTPWALDSQKFSAPAAWPPKPHFSHPC